jgi:hypothetical protein
MRATVRQEMNHHGLRAALSCTLEEKDHIYIYIYIKSGGPVPTDGIAAALSDDKSRWIDSTLALSCGLAL